MSRRVVAVSWRCRGGVEAVSRHCMTLVSTVSRCVNRVGPVSEGGLTVYTTKNLIKCITFT